LLQELKQRIWQSHVRGSVSANRELVLPYWRIGRDILLGQEPEHWGAKVIDRLAADLKKAFPEMKGFSPCNLKYMRAFAEAWPDEEFVQQAVAQIPWGHNIRILDHVKERRAREMVRPGYAGTRLEPRCPNSIRLRVDCINAPGQQ
jgi:predicted nuclease of restriction endonuclease-like (RecB) superfamily